MLKKSVYSVIIVLSFVMFLSANMTFAAAVLDFYYNGEDVDVITVKVCTEFNLDVVLENDWNPPGMHNIGLASFDVVIDISDPLVEGVSILNNPMFESVGPAPSINENNMRWGAFDYDNELGLKSDVIRLGTISLHCLASGMTEIFALPGEFEWFNSNYDDMTSVIEAGSIKINQVPIPGTLLLLLSGVCAMVGFKKKHTI